MIKTADKDSRKAVLSCLRRYSELDTEYAAFCLDKSDIVLVYENDSHDMIGFGTFRLWGEGKRKADIYVYVIPSARNSGTGGKLLDALEEAAKGYALDFTSTRVETNPISSLDFFQNRGYRAWYTELILYHSGERVPECDPGFVNYTDDLFDKYVNALRESFYELRSSNDFQPYYCCEATDDKRRELDRNKNNIYVLLESGNIVASVIVNAGTNGATAEDVFVTSAYRGKGIGRQMMCFAVNKAIDSGSRHVTLDAIEWNRRALHLYESVGFKIVKSVSYLRCVK